MIRSALLRMKAERQAREEAQRARDIANARAAAQWALAQRHLNGRVQHTVTAVPKDKT